MVEVGQARQRGSVIGQHEAFQARPPGPLGHFLDGRIGVARGDAVRMCIDRDAHEPCSTESADDAKRGDCAAAEWCIARLIVLETGSPLA